jgi:hypothetical protein
LTQAGVSLTEKGYMHQYVVVGRHKVKLRFFLSLCYGLLQVDDANPNPKVYRMKLFASNSVIARSRFWYYMKLLRKVKRQNGEIISVNEVLHQVFIIIAIILIFLALSIILVLLLLLLHYYFNLVFLLIHSFSYLYYQPLLQCDFI